MVITLPTSEIGLNVPVHFVYCLKADKTLMLFFFWGVIIVYSSVLLTVDISVFQKDSERFQLSDILQRYRKRYWKADTGFSHVIQICSVDKTSILKKLSCV